jgi:hypothetical protein
MAWISALLLAALGAVLLALGNLGGLMVIVWAALIAWPWPHGGDEPGADGRYDEEPGESCRPLPRRVRLLYWVLAVALLCTLIVGMGLIGYFVLGAGSALGLLIGSSLTVLSVRLLLRLEPRTP